MANKLRARSKTSSKSVPNSKTETNNAKKVKEFTKPSLISWRSVFFKVFLCFGILFGYYVFVLVTGKLDKDKTLAFVSEVIVRKKSVIECHTSDYEPERPLFPSCIPSSCGRVVSDEAVLPEQVDVLYRMVKSTLNVSRSTSCASIVDLHSGTLSYKDKFVNMYKVFSKDGKFPFTQEDLKTYSKVRERIRSLVSYSFNVDASLIYLAAPTFFSEMVADMPVNGINDEYWHTHVDKITYGSFHYTCLLYLNNYGSDFEGGRFIFVDSPKNVTVEPKKGRVMCFTSGSENPHRVEKLTRGRRNALTVAFTCDPSKAIKDPELPANSKN